MADEKSFLDSPILQALIPAAAVAATAIAPRRGGAAAQVGLSALGAMQQQRHQKMRLREVMAQRQQQAEADKDFYKMVMGESGAPGSDRIGEFVQTESGPSPAGGDAPEAHSAANATLFEHGNIPRPKDSWTPEQRQTLLALYRQDRTAGARAALEMRTKGQRTGVSKDRLAEYVQMEKDNPELAFTGIPYEGGGQVSIDSPTPKADKTRGVTFVEETRGGRKRRMRVYEDTKLPVEGAQWEDAGEAYKPERPDEDKDPATNLYNRLEAASMGMKVGIPAIDNLSPQQAATMRDEMASRRKSNALLDLMAMFGIAAPDSSGKTPNKSATTGNW